MTIAVADPDFTLYVGDALEVLQAMPAGSVHCCVTSPPYWGLRDYGTGTWEGGDAECDHQTRGPKYRAETSTLSGHGQDGVSPYLVDKQEAFSYRDICGKCGATRVDQQLGLEPTPDLYVANMVAVFREVRRVLRADGTLWLNIGDSYAQQGGRTDRKKETDERDSRRISSLEDGPQTRSGNAATSAGGSAIPARSGGGDQGSENGLGRGGSEIMGGEHDRRGEFKDRGAERGYEPGSNWANYGDRIGESRNSAVGGLKPKDLVGIPWRLAFALQADGWYLRSDIIWSKPNPMPESVTDRPTKAHEYLFLLTKSPRYFYDADAVRESYQDGPGLTGGAYAPPGQAPHGNARGPDGRSVTTVQGANGSLQHRDGERWPNGGRNKRSVWEIPTAPYPDAHFATFPPALVEPCVKAGCPEDGVVLDPFMGSGTTAQVARRLGRRSIGIELNPEYAELAARRLQQLSLFATADREA